MNKFQSISMWDLQDSEVCLKSINYHEWKYDVGADKNSFKVLFYIIFFVYLFYFSIMNHYP